MFVYPCKRIALVRLLGNGIIPARPKWVAPGNATSRQPGSARRAVFADRFDRVRGATGKITTGRRQQLTETDLVAAYREDEERAHESDLRAWRFSGFTCTTFAIV